jgi:transposase
MKIHTIGIDLGKTNFHLVGLNERGEVVVRKRFSRVQLLRFTANRKVHVIGMESCGGSHFLGRALQEQGHDSTSDACAVCEAVREDQQKRFHRCGSDR